MSTVDYIQTNPDLIEESKELLLDQFKNSPNVNTLLEIALSGEVDFNTLLVELAEETTLVNAVGEQLDEIGRQMGVPRTTDDDTQYRALIRLTGRRRTHNISKEGIIELLGLLIGTDEVEVYNGLNHVVEITVIRSCFDENVQDGESIASLMPLNTNLRILGSDGVLFGFENASNSKGGFSSVADRTAGGGFASIRFRTDKRE